MRAGFLDHTLNLFRMRAAAVGVDVSAIRSVVSDGDVCAQLAQNAGGGFISRTVRYVDRDAGFLQSHSARKTLLGKLDVAAQRVVNSRGTPDFSGGGPNRIDFSAENELLDLLFYLIIQFVAIVPEKFNSVVSIGIVRSREDDTGVRAQRTGDISDARGWQWADHQHIHSQRSNAGDECVLEHVTGEPGIFAEHNLRACVAGMRTRIQFRENVRRSAAELERSLGGDGLDIRDPAHAVRSKNFPVLAHPA